MSAGNTSEAVVKQCLKVVFGEQWRHVEQGGKVVEAVRMSEEDSNERVLII